MGLHFPEEESIQPVTTWNLETIVISERRQTPGHISPDPVHRIDPEQANHGDGNRLVLWAEGRREGEMTQGGILLR